MDSAMQADKAKRIREFRIGRVCFAWCGRELCQVGLAALGEPS